jgi:hypothetical protein
MTTTARFLPLLWMVAALWGGMLAAYFLRFGAGFLVASFGVGGERTGLVALWTTRAVGLVAIWLGTSRAERWWPVLSRRRLAIGALGGLLVGALLGYLLESVVGDSDGNVIVAVALLGYCGGVLLASAHRAESGGPKVSPAEPAIEADKASPRR